MNEWLEDQRDVFLCAIYDQRFDSAEAAFQKIQQAAMSQSDLSEYHQKILGQILVIFHRFKTILTQGCSEQVPAAARTIKTLLASYARKNTGTSPSPIDYPCFKALLLIPESYLKTLYESVISFQLTSGCSHNCRRCNEWALFGVRKHFSFCAVKQILQNIAETGNNGFALYAASDPLDWEDGPNDIRHILEFLKEKKIHLTFGLLTKIPKQKESLFAHLIQQKTNIAVSVTDRNRNRIKKMEALLPFFEKQHDSDDLIIPACRDEDFKTVKSSITDTYGTEISPDGAFMIIPTLTSALNPFGHKKIPISLDTSFFLQRKTGQQALRVEYFKPLEAITPDGKTFRLPRLLDTQIETLLLDNGSNELNVPGMTNIREFFDIFKPEAIRRRQMMLPSVMKNLKAAQNKSPYYAERVRACADFCEPGPVMTAKLYAVSFFLESIQCYAKQNPVRTSLVHHLRKPYIIDLSRQVARWSDQTDIRRLLTDPCTDSFLLFEYLKFKALASTTDTQNISAFIRNHPAVFDIISDRFVPATQT